MRLLIFPAFCEHYAGIQVTYSQLFLCGGASSFLVHQREQRLRGFTLTAFYFISLFRPLSSFLPALPSPLPPPFHGPPSTLGGSSPGARCSVAIIYRSPFSGQVIPAKIVAAVNYYRATILPSPPAAPSVFEFLLFLEALPHC